ncbi:M14 family metallopeptidase [Mucilaginibacter auburnensis]|uniref:Zinc carboxypeptidase n=1 Tax=Mucilaginibacter auburnensis TaxID=1457233 RepID=A0A2H9VRQ6_9SPHI|nr:M14 family metallopeptidase [Mucilaginibacter auburnensis]PJJ83500.1 zinc carboxypeptidase [Mucilaginibacter auburnensis]
MLKRITLLLLCSVCFFVASAQKLQSPDEFLGYKLGTQFSNHYRIADYFKYIAASSKQVKLVQYGTTNEGRPLMAMFIASAENIGKLESIRQNNLRLAGMDKTGAPNTTVPVIVWLSFNVHGNEPSSSEAAMQTLYDMADVSNTRTQAWLKNTVVVIDPCLNPDGRERYVNYYNSVKGVAPNTDPSSREHNEAWPGGRSNHYYFDLNRDWAWQVQKETQQRMALYNQWLPQIHVDFHEQGYNSPYYFAPAAQPFHRVITDWQKEFQTIIGKNNARYFDMAGWLYFTKEEFDLLYPSYGDTYPIYNGSIGMTYEQGGIGAGLAVTTRTGDVLTLADRVTHHHSNSLSTIETASENAQKAVTEFKKYFDNAATIPTDDFKTYIIKSDNEDHLAALGKLLDNNGIAYKTGLKGSGSGFDYFTGKTGQFSVGAKDVVISAYQPKSVLLNVLFEPKTFVADSNTYDITAWSLPYAYGLRTYGTKEVLQLTAATTTKTHKEQITGIPYAYISTWHSAEDAKFLAALLAERIKVRFSEKAFEVGGQKFTPGSLIITRSGNDRPDLDEMVKRLAAQYNRKPMALSSGFVEKGADLGSDVIRYIKPPKIMLVAGDGVAPENMGEVWHFFDQQLNYPVTIVRYNDLGRVRMADFNVIILPDGRYEDTHAERIANWVKDGGKLIAMGGAMAQLDNKLGFAIKDVDTIGNNGDAMKDKAEIKLYEDRNKDAVSSNVAGAIYKVNLDNSHPLAFGYPNYYYTLKLDDSLYGLLNKGWNVATLKKDAYVAGLVGNKSKQKLNKEGLLFGVQNLGRGSVVYMADDPLFRGFWENGKLLFCNAVFMVAQ